MKLLSKKSLDEFLVVSLDETQCRLQLFKQTPDSLQQLASGALTYHVFNELGDQLINWCKQHVTGKAYCRWVLSRNLYQTFQLDPPNVLPKELDEALKWQLKDLIDQPIDKVLVTHYQPTLTDNQNNQLVAVVTNRALVESIIDFTKQTGTTLQAIDIEELAPGPALKSHLEDEKIIGFIGEDNGGLVFNFYSRGGLAFTRYKKGRFMPHSQKSEFSLEQDREAEQDSFMLETQRTLDYVVSQIFRRPIDKILLQQNSDEDQQLAQLIKQITEIDVALVSPTFESVVPDALPANLSEVGIASQVSY